MIEIFNCIYIILFCGVLFRFKYNDVIIEKCFKGTNFSLVEKYSINILILLLLLLFCSFFNFNNTIFLYSLFFLSILSLLIMKRNILVFKLKNYQNFILIFFFTLVISINLVVNLKLEWDGHFWYLKALNFYENLSFFNLENTPNNHYPHLGGIVWGTFWKISLLNYEFFGRIIYIFIYVISILCIVEKISDNLNIKLLFSILLFFLTFDHFLFSGYQAYLLFCLIIIICNLLGKFNLKKLNYFQIIFIILSSYLLSWIKNEGTFYFLFITLFVVYFQTNNKKLFILFLFCFLILLRILLMNKISDHSLLGNTININLIFNDFFYKILLISKHIIIAMFKYPIWILILLSIFLKKLDKNEFYIIYLTILSILFVYFIYLNTDIKKLDWHLSGSIDRILFHLSGFYMLFLSYRLKYFCKNFIK